MKRILFTLPLIVSSFLIFYMSHQSSVPDIGFHFEGMDKVLHAIAFFFYGLFAQAAIIANSKKLSPGKIKFIAIIYSLIFAVFDELHQSFILGRDSSIFDFFADAAGIFISIIFFNILRKIIKKNNVKIRPSEEG